MPDELPIPFPRFAATLVDTHDEVFVHLMRTLHWNQNKTPSKWREALEVVKNMKV